MTRARSLSRLANSNAFTVDGSNNVGIGSTQPDVRLDVNGDMNVTGTLTYEDVTNVETAGITTTGGLVVTGLGATIGGITTFFGDINFGAAGVGGTVTTLGHAEFVGVVTASSFSGDGSGLTGVASTDNINTSTLAQFTGGVGIADSIFHIGDDNTAIRFPAADNFTVETGGSERFRVGPTGITTFTGNVSLTAGGAERLNIAHVSGGDVLIKNPTDAYLAFGTNDSERVRITNTGNVGIGTNNPGTSLEVFTDNDTDISDNSGTNNTNSILRLFNKNGSDGTGVNNYTGIRFDVANGATSSAYLNYVRTGDNQGAFLFKARNAASSYPEMLRITSGGALLVAKTTTSLTTQGSRVDNGLITVSGNSSSTNLATNSGGNLSLANVDSTDNNFSNIGGYNSNGLVVSQIDFINKSHSSRTGEIAFLTHNGSAMSERLRIDSSGKTGININNPGSYNSSGNELVLGNTSSNAGMTIVSNSANNGHIFFADGTASGAQNRGIIKYEHGNDAMAFNTAESERFRLGSSGQIGLGGANYGTAGQVITSNGSGSAPTWQDASGGISTQAGTASGIVTSMFLNDATDHKVTATGICTITTTQSGTEGQSHTIRIVNSGIATVGFSTYFLFPSGSAPVLPTADGAVSIISFTVHDSVGAGCTQLLAGAALNFS